MREETDGFKFAITALTAIGTLLFAVYSYFQTTSIDINYYEPIVGIFSVALILLIFLILYIIIKGYSFELQSKDAKIKERNNKRASLIYLMAFLIFIMLLTNVSLIFVFVRMGLLNEYISISIYIISVIVGLKFGWPYFEFNLDRRKEISNDRNRKNFLHYIKYIHQSLSNILSKKPLLKLEKLKLKFAGTLGNETLLKLKKLKIEFSNTPKYIQRRFGNILSKETHNTLQNINLAFIMLATIFIFWFFLFLILLISPLQGLVNIDMESIYYKNDAPIPVSIKMTGPNTGLLIKLYNESSEIDNITLKPTHSNTVVPGTKSILFGNSFDSGKYNVFINTTNPNMTIGYYELVFSRLGHEYGKGFYLLNNSRK